MKILKIVSLIALIVMTACGTKASNPNIEVVSPEVFQEKLSQDHDSYLLDVRTPDEYQAGHLEGAHLLDWLNQKDFKKESGNIDKTKTVYVYCRSGRRSNEAANYLANEGYKVVDMKGGILAWTDDKMPVVTGTDSSVQKAEYIN